LRKAQPELACAGGNEAGNEGIPKDILFFKVDPFSGQKFNGKKFQLIFDHSVYNSFICIIRQHHGRKTKNI
jgi:hypothetical protein